MVRIRTFGTEAAVDGGAWSCPDSPALEGLLTTMAAGDPAPGSHPDPDLYLAEQAVGELGGEIVQHDEPEQVVGRIY